MRINYDRNDLTAAFIVGIFTGMILMGFLILIAKP